MTFVFLDSDPVGLACHRETNPDAADLRVWLAGLRGTSQILIPAIIDYEVRRSLLKNNLQKSVRRLDDLYSDGIARRLELTAPVLNRAAELWAEARWGGFPTADDPLTKE